MNKMKPVNLHLKSVTIEDVEKHKLISTAELCRDLENLKKFNAKTNKNSFAGNPFLYHFQLENLLKCRREGGKTIHDIYNDPVAWDKLIKYTRIRNRGGKTAAGNVFECFRINFGSVVMFKATTAKYIYSKYNAWEVLDPCAGWGGRLLGAWALGIDYTGIDSNWNMKDAYDKMFMFLTEQDVDTLFVPPRPKLRMLWGDCLEIDFKKIKYDLVLTSPPYINLEQYEHMDLWESDKAYYYHFLFPLWEKCMRHIKKGGHVCLNISPKMYEAAQAYGIPKCNKEEHLKQQLGQKMNKKKQDMIYIWQQK